MKWFEVKTVEELRQLGKLKDIKFKVSNDLGPNIKVVARSWDDLFVAVKSLKRFVEFKTGSYEFKEKVENNVPYFKSEVDKLIYYIMELDGEVRQEKLNITPFHYQNKEFATTWRNKLMKKLHPDVCKHPMAQKATVELNYLYARMVQNGK
ncbi:hypothetical protein CN520_02720 [Bacillus cereus]|uniref:hypothetical protein n=1 Tax=Bacillus cereus group TaxID=86661 RepID=UPI0005C83A01|nr:MULTISPECIES: hypothetical protein [Bacillus cereus group]MBJ6721085.1 hypothetical protein [Bacillus sp. PR5]KIZ30619.1 hypothetical protein SK30_09295 [Bacillus cereus]MBM6766533.1 hypothetical protein [Bacillus cereus]MEB9973805.1 hypothetical protein [Bacillus cereus]PER83097.1 hypothetical protein CN487_06695 [Bacillus cereus]